METNTSLKHFKIEFIMGITNYAYFYFSFIIILCTILENVAVQVDLLLTQKKYTANLWR